MRMRIGFAAILGLLLTAPSVQATVLKFMDLTELAEFSTSVVRGEVIAQKVVEEEGHIWTDSSVRVSEVIRGKVAAGQVLVMRQLGGETPTRGERVAGMAQFSLGEDVLVFARNVGGRFHVPVGACLGKFSLYLSNKGERRVRRHLDDAAFARFNAAGRMTIRHGVTLTQESDMTLSALLAAIAPRTAPAKGGAK